MNSSPILSKTLNGTKGTAIPKTPIFINKIILNILPELENENKVLREIYYLLEDLIGQTEPWTFSLLELRISVLTSLDASIKEDQLRQLIIVLEGLLLTMTKYNLLTFDALAQFLSTEKKLFKEKIFLKNI